MKKQLECETLLQRLPQTRIGVVGDFCLDAYWETDNIRSELSVETGLPTRAVRTQRYSLGGAGNVASNLLAMGVANVSVYGVTGPDPFGYQMRQLMRAAGIRVDGLLEQSGDWVTHTYVKPLDAGVEANRIDFGNFNRLADNVALQLAEKLAADCADLDLIIINQQVADGIHRSERFQEQLQAVIAAHPGKTFLLDSRDMSGRYAGTIRKINAYEAMLLVGTNVEPRDLVSLDDARTAARKLAAEWGKPVFISRGDRGCLVADNDQVDCVPGLHVVEQTDPVGAGDSMVAGIAAALAVGCTPLDAATFGNFVAGVTVQKLHQTGTASPEEIRAIGASPDYVYLPERADDPRAAVYWQDTEIEMVTDSATASHRIAHAIFDHDGTISVLREGWEKIMEPMMLRTVLGPVYESADETTYHRVLNRVRTFIDATTGIQTLVQMQGLVKLVAEFGFVPAAEILDEFGYKAIYNAALLDLVRGRLAKFERGELEVADFAVKGAVECLRALHGAGVKLYMASGSDEDDVIAEAKALGYADLFEGRIYGAVGDVSKEAKKIVMDRILNDIGADQVSSMVAFGDGPVEIRESRKRGGLAFGIASDEVRRFGLNSSKRRRLIRAGANLIIPDFSQWQALLPILGIDHGYGRHE
ncbi:MAG: PfkB family carbohydrate kinase [Verrucomicrobia bacterium]|nr:PfkB family carbohydrate kinase [Verrucomicrobiota bacterium]